VVVAGTRREVSETIARYRPRSISPEAAGFAQRVVAAARPERPERAKALLFAAGKLADFGLLVGLELDAKLLLVTGSNDRTVPPAEAVRVRALLPAAELLSLPGLGHLAHEERPDEVAALLVQRAAP
jgi:pimeloyl-ACP methyl ester carboxylesterase